MSTLVLVVAIAAVYAALRLWHERAAAIEDGLTGLASRRYFERVLERCVARASRYPEYRFGVVVLEIGNQLAIRRSVGRFGRQDVMTDAAERLSAAARRSDTLARLSESRFGVIVDDVADHADAVTATRRLVATLSEGTTLSGTRLTIAVRAGFALSDGATSTARALIDAAGAALADVERGTAR